MADDILSISIDGVMTKEVVSVSPEMDVKRIAEILKKKNIGCVIVTDKGKTAGILTERDIIHKVVAPNVDPEKLLSKDIMTGNVITISPSMTIGQAVEMMKGKNIKKLPVTENGKLVGIVTLTDLLKILRSIESGMLKRFMKRKD